MRTLGLITTVALLTVTGCSSDDSTGDSPGGGTSGSGGEGSEAAGGAGNAGGGGSGGSGAEPTCQLGIDNGKDMEDLEGDIDADRTLSADKNYLIKGVVRVQDGATLTIEPCTTIAGDGSTLGTLVVNRGGKLAAAGTEDAPILFTSSNDPGSRAPGDWGGVILLGRAPNNQPDFPAIEGLTTDEVYGGTSASDDSGTLTYVRIEYPGIDLGDGNEVNGLTMGSVGSGTTVHHVMVSNTLDDCFEWFGGTVNADHLICNNAGDDMFDMDFGYSGKLQFLFGRNELEGTSDSPNGFECDNAGSDFGVTPLTNPTVYNATLCGFNTDAYQDNGAVFRRGMQGTFGNVLLTGWETGVDIRDVPPTETTMTSSVLFGNAEDVQYAEDGSNDSTEKDDDSGFDDVAWFEGGDGNNTDDPAVGDCWAATPEPQPASEVAGEAPPSGLDDSAVYVGAFKDSSDDWASGLWVDWAFE